MWWIMETEQLDLYYAEKNFLSKEECEGIILSGDITLVKDKINKAIFEWNDRTETRFVVDYQKQYTDTVLEGADESMAEKQPMHTIHKDNLQDECWKIQAYVILGDTDDYQGGELLLDDWPCVPYQDNFGDWKGDPEQAHQPGWINEQGTLFITHASKRVGFDRITNGSAPKLRIMVGGPAYK